MHSVAELVSLLLDDEGPYTITAGRPAGWRPGRSGDDSVWVTVKTSEPRGAPMAVMMQLAYAVTRDPQDEEDWEEEEEKLIKKPAEIVDGRTLAGASLKDAVKNYGRFKPAGLVLRFKKGVSDQEAVNIATTFLNAATGKVSASDAKAKEWKAGAGQRKKEMSKLYRAEYDVERQKLFDEFGKQNVLSVTARQIGGDDGYQWNVLINGRSFVNGLTQAEVPHYKRVAYADLLARNGKV